MKKENLIALLKVTKVCILAFAYLLLFVGVSFFTPTLSLNEVFIVLVFGVLFQICIIFYTTAQLMILCIEANTTDIDNIINKKGFADFIKRYNDE